MLAHVIKSCIVLKSESYCLGLALSLGSGVLVLVLHRLSGSHHGMVVIHGGSVFVKCQASTPGSSAAAAEGQGFRADHDQSRDVLVRDEAINSGPSGVNYRVSSVASCRYLFLVQSLVS